MKLLNIFTAAGLLIFVTICSAPVLVAENDVQTPEEQLRNALREVEVQAEVINHRADEIASMLGNMQYGWRSFAYELTRIRSALDEINEQVPTLQKLSAKVDWRKKAMDRLAAYLKALTNEAEAAIEFLNDEQAVVELQSRPFTLNITAIRNFSSRINELADYAKMRSDLEMKKSTDPK